MFLSSLTPDITEDIPTPLSGGGGRALAATGDNRFDVSVNGLPFNLRIRPNTPYKREGEQVRKEQFDTSGEPGEQSLASWWIRSQASWHMGAGIKYYDPGSIRETTNRFATSQGVDVWKQGAVSLLNSMTLDQSGLTEPVYLSTFRSQGRDGWVVAFGNTLHWRGGDAPGGTLVRTNRSRNPRIKSTAPNSQLFVREGTTPAVTADNPTTGGPLGFGYRGVNFTGTGTWACFTGDRDTGTAANPTTGISVDEDVTQSIYVYASWTGVATVTATLRLHWYDAGGSSISSTFASAELVSGSWSRLVVRDARPAGASFVRATIRWDSSADITNGSARTFGGLLEDGVELLPWFDGAVTDTAQHNYAWSGTADDSSSTDTYTPGTTQTMASGSATQPAPVGGSVYVGRTNAVSKWDVNNDILTTPYTCTGVARCWWAKDRLFVAVGRYLYWVDHTQTGVIPVGASGTNVELLATGPDDTWVWVDVTDTADSVLIAGAGETASSIYAITIEDVSGVPTLSSPREVARLPQGEQASCMGAYISSFIVLGTTHGVRVGGIGSNGQIQLGGLSVELDEAPIDVTFFDRFAYLPVSRALPDGTTGVVRVDLSSEILGEQGSTGLFPWAWDVYPGDSVADATSVAMNGNTGKVVLAHGTEVHVSTDTLLLEGYLDSGLIRFGTSEQKDFQRVRMTGDLNGGSVRVEALIAGTPASVYTYGVTTGLEGEATLNLPGGPLFDELAFRITITRQPSGLSPVVDTIAVKAVPAVRKSRLVTYPLQIADFESNRYGLSIGYDGFAIDRLAELEALENDAAAIQVIDRRYNEALVGTIEGLEFFGPTAPDGEHDNDGGVLTMVVRVR